MHSLEVHGDLPPLDGARHRATRRTCLRPNVDSALRGERDELGFARLHGFEKCLAQERPFLQHRDGSSLERQPRRVGEKHSGERMLLVLLRVEVQNPLRLCCGRHDGNHSGLVCGDGHGVVDLILEEISHFLCLCSDRERADPSGLVLLAVVPAVHLHHVRHHLLLHLHLLRHHLLHMLLRHRVAQSRRSLHRTTTIESVIVTVASQASEFASLVLRGEKILVDTVRFSGHENKLDVFPILLSHVVHNGPTLNVPAVLDGGLLRLLRLPRTRQDDAV
mmetsp:Transcript_46809/g.101685  ORF Transcript_46809/g.101685 Transcript_46809/m.101685 type:complete len:277 (+) Transcript_46809:620-1450(+)